MSTRDETTIYRNDDGTGVIVLSMEAAVCGGVYLIESINGGSRYLLIPDEHRAAVAAALCPPAPGEVRIDNEMVARVSRQLRALRLGLSIGVGLDDEDEQAVLRSSAEFVIHAYRKAAGLAAAAPEQSR